jgi:hypothetical protein
MFFASVILRFSEALVAILLFFPEAHDLSNHGISTASLISSYGLTYFALRL